MSINDPSTALFTALEIDLDPLTNKQIEAILEEHGWVRQRQAGTVRKVWHSPDNTMKVALSPADDPWHGREKCNTFATFSRYHNLSVLETFVKFGIS